MPPTTRSAPRRVRIKTSLWIGVAALAAGCSTLPPPPMDAGLNAAAAAGSQGAIIFRIDGGPIDEEGDPDALSMPEAVRLAVMTDPGIQAALARVRIALADAKQARLIPNPVLNLVVRFPEAGGKPVIETSLTQDLISVLRLPRRSGAADHRLRQASAAAVTTTIDVAAEVQERYVSAQSLERLLPVLEQRLTVTSRALDLARSRLSFGEGIRDDVVVLDTQRVELGVEIAAAARELRDERLRLARLIGRPSGAASWRLEPFTPVELTGTPVAAWIDASLRARPEVQERSWEIAALGDELALTRLLPYDGAGAGVSVERDGDWRAGPAVSVPLPVFDTGQARAERVTAQQIEARHGLVAVRRQVVEDVRRAWESMALSRDNARRVRQELLPLQEQRRALAEASFRAGQSDVTALFLAEQALRAAQARLIQLDRDTAVAAVRLQRAAGGPGPAAALAGPAAGSAPQPSPTSPPTLPPPPTPIQ